MATNINTILSWFKTGKKPTQKEFWDSWQSFWHKEEKIPITSIESIESILNEKAEKSLLDTKEDKNQKGAINGYAPLNELTKIPSEYLNIVNNVVTGGENQILSAEQGKSLKTLIDSLTNSKQDVLSDVNVGAFESTVPTVTNIADTDRIPLLTGSFRRMIGWSTFKSLFKTVNGNSLFGSGNLSTPDMDTTSAQNVSGIKTFLNGMFGLRNRANTFTSYFTNNNTASRMYTLQNDNGTLMFCDAPNLNLSGSGNAVQLLSSIGTPSRGGSIVALFAFVQSTWVTVINSTLTSILSGTIFGNLTLLSSSDSLNPMLAVGKSFTGKAVGVFSSIDSETFKLILKLGSTTILDTGFLTFSKAINAQSIEVTYDFTVLTQGSSGTIAANLKIFLDGEPSKVIVEGPVIIDTTSNQNFDIQCAYGSTNSGNTVTFKTIKGFNDAN